MVILEEGKGEELFFEGAYKKHWPAKGDPPPGCHKHTRAHHADGPPRIPGRRRSPDWGTPADQAARKFCGNEDVVAVGAVGPPRPPQASLRGPQAGHAQLLL